MRWRYDQRLIETVVFEAVRRGAGGQDADMPARYHRLVDPLYDIADATARERAFFDANWTMFAELGFDRVFAEALREYARVAAQIPEGVVATAVSARDEGAELFVRDGGSRTLVVRARARRFLEPPRLSAFYHHELAHIDDLLDPVFAYQKNDLIGSAGTLNEKLIRERYRVLWAIGVDGRTARRGLAPFKSREERYMELCRTFPFLDEPDAHAWFGRLWHDERLTHPQLLELARRPRGSVPRQEMPSRQGLSCPLCGFPSHTWGEPRALPDRVRAQIRSEFPAWAPSDGLCERCVEVYGTLVSQGAAQ